MTTNNRTKHTSSKSLKEIITSYFNFLDESEIKAEKSKKRPSRKPETSTRLKFLKPIPWILGLLFAFSFYWDFDGVETTVNTLYLNFEGLLRIISISGLIGFLTNRIAITMLFRPMKKRPLLGQGLIPAHKERIARRLALSVADDLINPELIQKKLEQSEAISRYRNHIVNNVNNVLYQAEFRADLKLWLSSTMADLISDKELRDRMANGIAEEVERSASANSIEKAALRAYMFLRGHQVRDLVDNALMQLPDKFDHELTMLDLYLDKLPHKIKNNSESIDQFAALLLKRLIGQLDVEKIVEENLRQYDEEKLERMIKGATNEQLHTIQYLGAVLGTIGGFVIWEPMLSLVVIGTLFGLIYLSDKLLQ